MNFRKFIAAAIVMALAVIAVPMADAEAKGETWKHTGDGWHYLEGTDIGVRIEGEVIRVTGTGAIPDYDEWSLDERPWAKASCKYLFIEDTITSIGKYAFYNLRDLKYITLSSKTFIADTTSFGKIAYLPVYRIVGNEETTKMIGTIPFTSYDSIKRFAQGYNGSSYILDTIEEVHKFQDSTNPTISNVFYAGDTSGPWNNLERGGNGGVYTNMCSITTPNISITYGAFAQQRYQGDACMAAYAAFIGDYTFATTFNMTVMNAGKVLDYTDDALQYTLSIPKQYRLAGRTFRILAIGNGVVNIYDDLDTVDATVTFKTDTPTTAYALVYK